MHISGQRRFVILAAAAAALLIIGASLAYYFASADVGNKFETAEARVYMTEKFDPADKWVPGEEKQKEVRFGNDGGMDAVIRVRFDRTLKLSDGTEVTDQDILDSFELNFADGFADSWVKGDDGWYYSRKVLQKGERTDLTLKSVTVSSLVSNDVHGVKTDYSSAVFSVDVKGELIQASVAKDAAEAQGWGMIPQISGSTVEWSAK